MRARVLLVDDEQTVLKGWVKALKTADYTVFTAETEAAAVKIATTEPIDLVVVDYILGPSTGISVLNAIRKKRPLVRSILISGQIDSQLDENAIRDLIRDKVEVDLYLHKPVRNQELRGAIAGILGNKDEDWQQWAQKSKQARETDSQTEREASQRLNQHLKKHG